MRDGPAARLELDVRLARPGFELEVSVLLDNGGITGLFGPSGSGKSTLLRIIAGLERSATGTVRLGAHCWQDGRGAGFVPPHRRAVGFVFQDARLFPHLDVAGNLEFARSRSGPASIGLPEVSAALDLDGLLARDVSTLSGGERQRVAIGRALMSRPDILLLDEPVAALDTARKRDILHYIAALPGRFGIPAIYVSHAAGEMARLADRVLVLEAGRITADGPVGSILNREALKDSDLSFEPVTILDVDVIENLPDVGLTRVTFADQRLTVPMLHDVGPGDPERLIIRAGDVVIATSEPRHLSVRNVLPGTVTEIEETRGSAFALVSVDIGGASLKAQLTRHAIAELGLSAGSAVYALVKTAAFERNG